MKILVTYASKYGSTKQYAQWIGEALSCDVKDAKKVGVEELKGYDAIIHGGGLYAGGLSGIQIIVRNFDSLADKHLILFSCGLADPNDPKNVSHIEDGLAKVLTPEMQSRIQQFHLRGGINYAKLGVVHRAMMAMLCATMRKKGYDNLTEEDKLMLDTYGKQIDFSDRNSITPLVDYVRGLGE